MWRLLAGVLAVISVARFGRHGPAVSALLGEPNFAPTDCSGNPCLHNGACTDRAGGFTCRCAADYAGVYCESGIWSEWTAWSKCREGCDRALTKRTRKCTTGNNCVGKSEDTETCTKTGCPAKAATMDNSVAVITKVIAINFNIPNELSRFYRQMAGFINGHCSKDKDNCCKKLLDTNVGLNPAKTQLTIAIGKFIFIGNGSPSAKPDGTKQVTLSFKGYESELNKQCRSSSRRKRETEQLQYLNKYFIAEALNSNISRLEQIFNATVLAVYPVNSTSPISDPQDTTAILAGVIGIITLMVVSLMIVTIFALMRVEPTLSFRQSNGVRVSSIPPRRRRYVRQ